MNRSQRRSKILVDRQVQGTIVRRLVLHWLIASLVAMFYLLVLQAFANGMQKPISSHFAGLWENYGSLLIVLITLFPVFIYDSIRVSHRFAGPMVSFRKELKNLADGESITPVSCRNNDFWSDVAGHLNRIAQRLGQVEGSAPKSATPPA